MPAKVRELSSSNSMRGDEFERWCDDELKLNGFETHLIWGACGLPTHPKNGGRCNECIFRSQRDGDIVAIIGVVVAHIECKSFSPEYPDTILINEMQQKCFQGAGRWYMIGKQHDGRVKIFSADRVANAAKRIVIDGEVKFQFDHTKMKPDFDSFSAFKDYLSNGNI